MPGLSRIASTGAALAALVCVSCATAWAEPGRWVPVSGRSQVAFDAKFSLGDFSGTGERLVGEFTLDPADLRSPVSGVLTIEVGGLTTGLGGRDRDMRKVLEVDRFPTIRFTVEGVEASFLSVTDKADVLLTIRGQLLIRDVERPLTILGRARLRDGTVWVRGDSTLRMSDFGISPPRRLFMTVADQVIVRFDLTLSTER